MLTELVFDENDKARIDLVDGTTMSVITPERRRAVDASSLLPLERLAVALGVVPATYADAHPIADDQVEVAFVHPTEPRHLPEVKVPEWTENQKDAEYSGSWTLYHVTPQQVLDYANKVGVK